MIYDAYFDVILIVNKIVKSSADPSVFTEWDISVLLMPFWRGYGAIQTSTLCDRILVLAVSIGCFIRSFINIATPLLYIPNMTSVNKILVYKVYLFYMQFYCFPLNIYLVSEGKRH